jgi:acylpyruvate hydrolase
MLFRIPRLLSDISKVMTLEEGDVVLTGTPKGVGPVVGGDVMRVGLEVGGKEVDEGRIEVMVEDAGAGVGGYEYKET